MILPKRLLWVVFYGLVVFLSLNRHSRSGQYNYHSEIWADKAGYMVYLPAAFCYGFEARKFPDSVDVRTGLGFRLDLTTNRVQTKYSYGVALLQVPFWGVAHWLSPDKSGFSVAAHKAIDVASATYFVWGLGLLFVALRRHFSRVVAVTTLGLLVLGTNLWYYGIIETGMSHAYSFFAFALLLWLVGRSRIPEWSQRAEISAEVVAIAATLGLISVLRPLNLLLALPLLLWPVSSAVRWSEQLRGLLNWRSLGAIALGVVIFWIPQLMYYKYARGGYFVYSYGHEGFPYLLSPRLAEVWFAPNNGAFLYNPLLLLVVPGLGLLARRVGWWSGLAVLTWLLASYLYAGWWAYALGCGYGGRGFVELYPVLAWPLAAVVENAWTNRRWLVGTVCVLLVAYNLRLSLRFDGCFYGKHDWDWMAYRALLQGR
jgi:hypothetical protein